MQQEQFSDDKIEQGFSSEDQFKAEQILYTESPKEKTETPLKEEIKFKIPPAQEIAGKKYSLRPDILTGWEPKIQLPSPVPIIFESPKYDVIIKRLLKKHSSKARVCYLGPKYQNTYFAWYNKQFTFPYNHMKSPHNIKFSDRQFCGQHWQAQSDLQFDSMFESGNLDCAVKVPISVKKVGQYEYELFMRVYSNTRGHLQWFNFKVKNLQRDREYIFSICNFQKKKILYGRGLKPYVFSAQGYQRQKTGWQQRGQYVAYEKKVGKTFRHLGIQSSKYCKLSFTISTSYQNDELQLAYCVPYTYTQMSEYLHKKQKELQRSHKDILKVSKLCDSLGGLEVPLLIVHQTHKEKTQSTSNGDEDPTMTKRCVIICGRAHPGQSNGSYMVEGFLDFICGDTKMAQFLRKHVIFKIVPMINPDGVALGNYRTGLSGRDFNRQYRDPDKQVFPEIFAFKKLVTENKLIFKDNLCIFLDFHGHSVKKNTFTYGPQFPIVNKFYYESRILPKIIGNLTPMFRYYSCSFKVAECKNTTARAVLLRKLNIPLAYTIEASNGFYFDYQKLKDVAYTDSKWKQMGEKVGEGVHGYMQLVIKADMLRQEKQKCKKMVPKNITKKNGRSVSNTNNHSRAKNDINLLEKPCQSLILEGIEDQGIKKLFEQIRKAEQEKSKQLEGLKCSDDQMSEGSSDGEGEQDDLSKKQFNKLLNCIKNKKLKNLDKCKLSPVKRTKTNEDDDDIEMDELNVKGDQRNQLASKRLSQELIVKPRSCNKTDAKKQFIFNLVETRKRSNTPKIVNFSFGLSFTPQKKVMQKNSMLTTKVNFFDAGNYSREQAWKHEAAKLSDIVMRKTFHSGAKQAKQRQKQGGHQRVNIFTTTTYVSKHITGNREHLGKKPSEHGHSVGDVAFHTGNRRNSRFENQRLKKMAIDNLGCV